VLFSRDKAEPSASIVLKVRGALEPQQVRAIRHLVASAVNGLKPQRVSIVDETGRLLADGSAEDAVGGASADERRLAFERRLREQVESIVTSVVGPGRARVQLTADFDFNRITQTSDRFDPEGRVVRSSQSREEILPGNDPASAPVSVGNELPGAARQAAEAAQPREQNRKSEEIVNYEISRTTKTEVIEGGRVNRISVAVVVDGNYTRNDKNELVYEPRSKEEIDRIAALVRSAIGFDQKRGDQVEVANLRLAETPAPVLAGEPDGLMGLLQFTKHDLMRGIELAVMTLLGLLVLLLVVRPMVRRILAAVEPAPAVPSLAAPAAPGSALALAQAGLVTASPGPSIAIGESEPVSIPASRTSTMIDIAQVQGQVHAQSVQKVGELAEKNPNETVAIIRGWLHENAA
jgi:flagellar M-ring protein FliF